jgi:ABC-type multidrug transport system ATPase subunit
VRQFIGICPQHDIFFELLTPREHLEIFYDFKGGDPNPEMKELEIKKLLVDVDLDKS